MPFHRQTIAGHIELCIEAACTLRNPCENHPATSFLWYFFEWHILLEHQIFRYPMLQWTLLYFLCCQCNWFDFAALLLLCVPHDDDWHESLLEISLCITSKFYLRNQTSLEISLMLVLRNWPRRITLSHFECATHTVLFDIPSLNLQ